MHIRRRILKSGRDIYKLNSPIYIADNVFSIKNCIKLSLNKSLRHADRLEYSVRECNECDNMLGPMFYHGSLIRWLCTRMEQKFQIRQIQI